MLSDPLMQEANSGRLRLRFALATALAILTIALRSFYFGNPIVHIDEQFYLLVGDRMLHGAVPYVDVWDRKPYGLFLLYAGIRLLGGEGILQYQVIAALVAAATTGLIVWWTAREGGRLVGAAVAGLLYIAVMHRFTGWGGESEVFLNLFQVGAAALTWCVFQANDKAETLLRDGALIMFVIGLALQIKTTIVFPGFLFGCMLLWQAWRADWSLPRIAMTATLWIIIAALPTLIVVLGYFISGHLDAWLFANVSSNFMRDIDYGAAERRFLLVKHIAAYVAVAAVLFVAQRRSLDARQRRQMIFLFLWLGSCVVAALGLGGYYANYALIVGPPAAILIGSLTSLRKFGILGVVFTAVLVASVAGNEYDHIRQDVKDVQAYRRVLVLIKQNKGDGCLFVYRGEPAFYLQSQSCLPTKFVFPPHISAGTEEDAIGVNSKAEVQRILDTKPTLIVWGRPPVSRNVNHKNEELLTQTLQQKYELITDDGGYVLYRRKKV